MSLWSLSSEGLPTAVLTSLNLGELLTRFSPLEGGKLVVEVLLMLLLLGVGVDVVVADAVVGRFGEEVKEEERRRRTRRPLAALLPRLPIVLPPE